MFTLNKATELAERTVALSTYMRLAQSRPQPLPNLVRLYIEVPCALLEQWPLFASSNLTHLEMAGIQIDHAHIIDPFMSILACLSQASMESLVLCGRFSWSNALGSFVQFRCLHSLIVSDPISAETLRGFGSLLGLRRLHVILEDTTVSDVPSDFGFSMLETLKIKGTPSVLQCVLDNMSTRSLIDITVEVVCESQIRVISKIKKKVEVVYPPDDWWKRRFAALNSRWSSTLTSISISLDGGGTGQPKIPLKNSRFSPTTDEIRCLASVCPGIRELRLFVADCIPEPTVNTSPGPQVPVDTLQVLAEQCPELSFLSIGLDIDSLPPFLQDKVYSHRLQRLCVGSAPATRATANLLKTARHLHRLFPHLEEVQTCPDYSASDWKRIGEMIRAYQDICLDESLRGRTRVNMDNERKPSFVGCQPHSS